MAETSTPESAAASRVTAPWRASTAPSGLLRRSAGAARGWLKDTFSRDRVGGGLKQLAWVAPLTVLIWVYAERAQQDTRTIPFTVDARSANQNVHVTITEPSDGIVQAALQGARSRLEKALEQVGSQDPVFVEVPFDAKPGVQTFPVERILSADPRFRGLTWQSGPNSTPAGVEVLVDPIEEQTLPVQVRKEDQERLEAGGAVFNPAQVKVRMPGAVAQIARAAGGDLVAYADLSALKATMPGTASNARKQTISDVRVFVDGAEREEVRIEPGTVSATLTLREEDRTYTIVQLPVATQGSNNVLNEYVVEFDPATLFNVEVVGPPRVIDKLASEKGAGVSAFVTVSKEDIGEERQKRVNFILPELVRLHPDSPDHFVRVTLTPRTSGTE